MPEYSNTQLLIDGAWGPSQAGKTLPVLNPATNEQIGTVAHAGPYVQVSRQANRRTMSPDS